MEQLSTSNPIRGHSPSLYPIRCNDAPSAMLHPSRPSIGVWPRVGEGPAQHSIWSCELSWADFPRTIWQSSVSWSVVSGQTGDPATTLREAGSLPVARSAAQLPTHSFCPTIQGYGRVGGQGVSHRGTDTCTAFETTYMQAPGTKAANHKYRVSQCRACRRTLLSSVLLATTTVGCNPVSTPRKAQQDNRLPTPTTRSHRGQGHELERTGFVGADYLRNSIATGDEEYPGERFLGLGNRGMPNGTSKPTPHDHLRLGIAKQ